jgi:phosphoadenosine phosphosulfate reductase
VQSQSASNSSNNFNNRSFSDIAARLAAGSAARDLFDRIADIQNQVVGRVVFTTSFGLEDQAITHAIFNWQPAIDVVTLDTGRLFPETHQVWAETERRYSRRIRAFSPEHPSIEAWVAQHGVDGFRSSVEARHGCCSLRKVEPLRRALAGASAWITGLRAEQSSDRAGTPYASIDPEHQVLKLNPLLDWTRVQVLDFVRRHGIPYNRLHDRGFLSIGCAPCTRAVAPGEPERAGRWWWEHDQKKECGLHINSADHPRGDSALSLVPAGNKE